MPVVIYGDTENNTVEVSPKFLEEGTGSITLNGTGAVLRIAEPLRAGHIYATVAGDSSLIIGPQCVIGTMAIHTVVAQSHIKIGAGVGFNGSADIVAHEASTIDLGDECLVADGCHLNSSDVHHIYDLKTHERLNPAADITIGRHVWLTADVRVMKGASVGEMSVVGASTIVTGSFPANSLIAGSPPRVIRSGIYWKR